MKWWRALLILLLCATPASAGFWSSFPGVGPGTVLNDVIIENSTINSSTLNQPIINDPTFNGTSIYNPGTVIQYDPSTIIYGPNGSVWNINGITNLKNLTIAAGGTITVPSTGTITGPDGGTWTNTGITLPPTSEFTGGSFDLPGGAGSWNSSGLTVSNINITGVPPSLTFNGVPIGGVCPSGQFVNIISNTGVPGCATPAGGGGGGGPADGLNEIRRWSNSGTNSANSYMAALYNGEVGVTPNATTGLPIIDVYARTANTITATPIRSITNVNAGIALDPSGIPRSWGFKGDATGRWFYVDFASSTNWPPTGTTGHYRVVEFAPGANGAATPDIVITAPTASTTIYPANVAVNSTAGLIAVLMGDSSTGPWTNWVEFFPITANGSVSPTRVLNLPVIGNGWDHPFLDDAGNLWLRSEADGTIVEYAAGASGTATPILSFPTTTGGDWIEGFSVDQTRKLVHALFSDSGTAQDYIYDSTNGSFIGNFAMGSEDWAYLFWLPPIDQLAFLYVHYNTTHDQGAIFFGYGTGGGGGGGGNYPTGLPPMIAGFDPSGLPEAETVSGDGYFTRTGANAYHLTVTGINGVAGPYQPLTSTSTTAPTSPVVGQMWFDPSTLQTYIWYNDGTSSQWVAVVNLLAAFNNTVLNNPTMTGTVTFPGGSTWNSTNLTIAAGTTSTFNGPVNFNSTTNFVGTMTFPDGSYYDVNGHEVMKNLGVGVVAQSAGVGGVTGNSIVVFKSGWSPDAGTTSGNGYWDRYGLEQMYDIASQYLDLGYVGSSNPNLGVDGWQTISSDPNNNALNNPWGELDLINKSPPQGGATDSGQNQRWQPDGMENMNAIGIHQQTWQQGCTGANVSGANLSDCAVAATASSLNNNVNYKMLVTNPGTGALTEASYVLQNGTTTPHTGGLYLTGTAFTPVGNSFPSADQLVLNTTAANGIAYTIGSGSTLVARMNTTGLVVPTTKVAIGQAAVGPDPLDVSGKITGNDNPVLVSVTNTYTGPAQEISAGFQGSNGTHAFQLVETGAGGEGAGYFCGVQSIVQDDATCLENSGTGGIWIQSATGPVGIFGGGGTGITVFPAWTQINHPINLNVASNTGSQIFFGSGNPGNVATSNWGAMAITTGNYVMASGAYQNNNQWVASNASAVLENLSNSGGGATFYVNTGLTVGATFTPTIIASMTATGMVQNLNTNGTVNHYLQNTNTGANVQANFNAQSNDHTFQFGQLGSGWTNNPFFPPDSSIIETDGPQIFIGSYQPNTVINFNITGSYFGEFKNASPQLQGLMLPGYGSIIGNATPGLMVGNSYFTGTNFANVDISGAAYPLTTGGWVADGGAGSGGTVAAFGPGTCITFYNYAGVAGGVHVTLAQIAQWCGSGQSTGHIQNIQTEPVPNITSGSLVAGSRDTTGWITNITGGQTTMNFGEAFDGQSTCTLTASGAPMVWFNANQTRLQDTFVCYDPTTGARCADGQTVEYHCFGQGDPNSYGSKLAAKDGLQ